MKIYEKALKENRERKMKIYEKALKENRERKMKIYEKALKENRERKIKRPKINKILKENAVGAGVGYPSIPAGDSFDLDPDQGPEDEYAEFASIIGELAVLNADDLAAKLKQAEIEPEKLREVITFLTKVAHSKHEF